MIFQMVRNECLKFGVNVNIQVSYKFIFIDIRRLLGVIFQLDVVHHWPGKLPQKTLDESFILFSIQAGL